jgi:predicted transcriptional regulator
MTNNLIAELVRKGIAPRVVAKEIAKTIGASEKTARNKINGVTEWTVPEAMKINGMFFNGAQSIEYLFANADTRRAV